MFSFFCFCTEKARFLYYVLFLHDRSQKRLEQGVHWVSFKGDEKYSFRGRISIEKEKINDEQQNTGSFTDPSARAPSNQKRRSIGGITAFVLLVVQRGIHCHEQCVCFLELTTA